MGNRGGEIELVVSVPDKRKECKTILETEQTFNMSNGGTAGESRGNQYCLDIVFQARSKPNLEEIGDRRTGRG